MVVLAVNRLWGLGKKVIEGVNIFTCEIPSKTPLKNEYTLNKKKGQQGQTGPGREWVPVGGEA
jgi:hypothetical protein